MWEDEKTLSSLSLVSCRQLHLISEKGAGVGSCLLCSWSKSPVQYKLHCVTQETETFLSEFPVFKYVMFH